jgi:hypothetical protein
MKQSFRIEGIFEFKFIGKDGLIKIVRFRNGVTTVGSAYLLAAGFQGGAQSSSWNIGLIDGSSTPVLNKNDAMNSHSGWTENVAYPGNRPLWVTGTPSGGLITNPTGTPITFNNNVTIAGAFLVNQNTRGGTTGTLFCTGLAPVQNFIAAQTVSVSYTLAVTPTS